MRPKHCDDRRFFNAAGFCKPHALELGYEDAISDGESRVRVCLSLHHNRYKIEATIDGHPTKTLYERALIDARKTFVAVAAKHGLEW